ncbi:hypothetical protein [Streptomyces sp. NPDC008141]|uniref:hypothetical protein n=1 Tax=Streptomyces sp. NPDC008141 TaxID=3364815 RepID=UPI0036EE7157
MTKKMKKAVKDCLFTGDIGGAAALIVGRFVSKDVAADIAQKSVVRLHGLPRGACSGR